MKLRSWSRKQKYLAKHRRSEYEYKGCRDKSAFPRGVPRLWVYGDLRINLDVSPGGYDPDKATTLYNDNEAVVLTTYSFHGFTCVVVPRIAGVGIQEPLTAWVPNAGQIRKALRTLLQLAQLRYGC